MLNWFIKFFNTFVVVHGDTTVALGHGGMLVTSQTAYADDNAAFVMPAPAL